MKRVWPRQCHKRIFGTSNSVYSFVTQRFKFNSVVSYICSFSSLISSGVSFYFQIDQIGFFGLTLTCLLGMHSVARDITVE